MFEDMLKVFISHDIIIPDLQIHELETSKVKKDW